MSMDFSTGFAVAPPAMELPGGVIWNPADMSTNLALSNDGLTLSPLTATANKAARATAGSGGKFYFEVAVDAHAMQIGIGVGLLTATVLDGLPAYIGGQPASWGYLQDGLTYNNNSGTASGTAFTTGDVVMVACHASAGKLWFGRNGAWLAGGDPANGTAPRFTNLSGTAYPMVSITNDTVTGRFAAPMWSYPAPAGFAALTA